MFLCPIVRGLYGRGLYVLCCPNWGLYAQGLFDRDSSSGRPYICFDVRLRDKDVFRTCLVEFISKLVDRCDQGCLNVNMPTRNISYRNIFHRIDRWVLLIHVCHKYGGIHIGFYSRKWKRCIWLIVIYNIVSSVNRTN